MRPFHFETKNSFGSDEFYQNYTAIDGTIGNFGYYAFYDHRERDGFRENSQYQVDSGSTKFVYDLSDDSRIIVTGDAYYEEHGEPGGLRRMGDPAGDPLSVNDPTGLGTRRLLRRRPGPNLAAIRQVSPDPLLRQPPVSEEFL